MIRKFRKKPVTVEAIEYNGNNEHEIIDWTVASDTPAFKDGDVLKVKTLEGDMIASVGDFVIRGVKGEHYPCKPDIMEKSYDAV